MDWIGNDVILDMSWLFQANSIIYWISSRVLLCRRDEMITLDAEVLEKGKSHSIDFLTSKRLVGLPCKKKEYEISHNGLTGKSSVS